MYKAKGAWCNDKGGNEDSRDPGVRGPPSRIWVSLKRNI